MSTPAERLAAADELLSHLTAQRDAARIERDRLVHEFYNGGQMSAGAMAEVLHGHRSWPKLLSDGFPERERRYLSRINA